MKIIIKGLFSFIVIFFLILQLSGLVQANSGTFEGPYVTINYTVSGATLGKYEEFSGFTYSRRYEGQLGSDSLQVSGSITMDAYPSNTIVVTVTAGGKSDEQRFTVDTEYGSRLVTRPFSVSVKIPDDAVSGSFSIGHTGHSPYGNRGVIVSGQFSRPGKPVSSDNGESSLFNGGSDISDDDDAGISWVSVVGVMSAVVAAAAALASRARNKKKGDDSSQDRDNQEQDIIGYILQVSTNEIILQDNEPQFLSIKCWKVNPQGDFSAAHNAQIDILPPPSTANISIKPLRANGSANVEIVSEGLSEEANYKMVVNAAADGTSINETIDIRVVQATYMLIVE